MRYLLLLIALAACSATGPEYTGQKGIIVYRDDSMLFIGRAFPIDVNGVEGCQLHNAGYAIIPKTGEITLSSSLWDQPGTSRISLNVKDAEYVKVSVNQGSMVAGAAAGMVGVFAHEAIEKQGPFIFTHMEAGQAHQELVGLKQDCI